MSAAQRDESRRHQDWWCVDLFGLSPRLLPGFTRFRGQNSAQLISRNGALYGATLISGKKRDVCTIASAKLPKVIS
jgi:hypothetical protein